MNNWFIIRIKINDQIVIKEKLPILKIHQNLLKLKKYKFSLKSVIMIKILAIIKKMMIKK
jgi:hypothetical protein